MIYLSVMIGGGLGSLLRFLISSFGFLPFATVFINIVGNRVFTTDNIRLFNILLFGSP